MTLIVEPTPVRVALGLWAGVVLCAAPLAAQDWEAFEGPRVEGLVLQSASGEPIESAAVRVVTEDGQQVLGSGYTDGDGRYRIFVFGAHDEHPGPVVVEAGRLGYRIAIGEPFEIDPDGVIQHPPPCWSPMPSSWTPFRWSGDATGHCDPHPGSACCSDSSRDGERSSRGS